MYRPGDYVVIADLPHHPLCRVAGAEHAGGGQILTLEPLEGPWRAWGTALVRFDEGVRPAPTRELWRAHVRHDG